VDYHLHRIANGIAAGKHSSAVVVDGEVKFMRPKKEKKKPEKVLSIEEAEKQLDAARRLHAQRVADRQCYGLRDIELRRAEERMSAAIAAERRAS
jgi:hypothetical protein